MNIVPVAADSLGTRSMATFVETESCNIMIDPAVSLGPRRKELFKEHPADKSMRRMRAEE